MQTGSKVIKYLEPVIYETYQRKRSLSDRKCCFKTNKVIQNELLAENVPDKRRMIPLSSSAFSLSGFFSLKRILKRFYLFATH